MTRYLRSCWPHWHHVGVFVDYTLTLCQRSHWLRGHTFFANILAKTKNFAEPLLPFKWGSGAVFLIKKGRKSRDTVPLMQPRLWLLIENPEGQPGFLVQYGTESDDPPFPKTSLISFLLLTCLIQEMRCLVIVYYKKCYILRNVYLTRKAKLRNV